MFLLCKFADDPSPPFPTVSLLFRETLLAFSRRDDPTRVAAGRQENVHDESPTLCAALRSPVVVRVYRYPRGLYASGNKQSRNTLATRTEKENLGRSLLEHPSQNACTRLSRDTRVPVIRQLP